MKTLIVYATKYKSTERCAELLAETLHDGADLVNLSKNSNPDLHHYNLIVVGSPIYEDRLLPKMQHFCKKNKPILLSGLFACFLCQTALPSEVRATFENAFDKDLLQAAVAKASFGGEINWEKLSIADRLLYGKDVYRETKKHNPSLHLDKIKSFAFALELKDKDYQIEEV